MISFVKSLLQKEVPADKVCEYFKNYVEMIRESHILDDINEDQDFYKKKIFGLSSTEYDGFEKNDITIIKATLLAKSKKQMLLIIAEYLAIFSIVTALILSHWDYSQIAFVFFVIYNIRALRHYNKALRLQRLYRE